MLIDSHCLEKIELSIGFRAKLFAPNNLGWFPINLGGINRFSYKKFWPQNFLYAFLSITMLLNGMVY
ncbi:hypothetical protein AH332_16145 [Salmonella enterica subsp. salamae]|nr:hypothetical protein [Salmonella enterica subsp. salamae]